MIVVGLRNWTCWGIINLIWPVEIVLNRITSRRRLFSPKAFAEYLLALNEDDGVYHSYLSWRDQTPRLSHQQLRQQHQRHPFVRLCECVQQFQEERTLQGVSCQQDMTKESMTRCRMS